MKFAKKVLAVGVSACILTTSLQALAAPKHDRSSGLKGAMSEGLESWTQDRASAVPMALVETATGMVDDYTMGLFSGVLGGALPFLFPEEEDPYAGLYEEFDGLNTRMDELTDMVQGISDQIEDLGITINSKLDLLIEEVESQTVINLLRDVAGYTADLNIATTNIKKFVSESKGVRNSVEVTNLRIMGPGFAQEHAQSLEYIQEARDILGEMNSKLVFLVKSLVEIDNQAKLSEDPDDEDDIERAQKRQDMIKPYLDLLMQTAPLYIMTLNLVHDAYVDPYAKIGIHDSDVAPGESKSNLLYQNEHSKFSHLTTDNVGNLYTDIEYAQNPSSESILYQILEILESLRVDAINTYPDGDITQNFTRVGLDEEAIRDIDAAPGIWKDYFVQENSFYKLTWQHTDLSYFDNNSTNYKDTGVNFTYSDILDYKNRCGGSQYPMRWKFEGIALPLAWQEDIVINQQTLSTLKCGIRTPNANQPVQLPEETDDLIAQSDTQGSYRVETVAINGKYRPYMRELVNEAFYLSLDENSWIDENLFDLGVNADLFTQDNMNPQHYLISAWGGEQYGSANYEAAHYFWSEDDRPAIPDVTTDYQMVTADFAESVIKDVFNSKGQRPRANSEISISNNQLSSSNGIIQLELAHHKRPSHIVNNKVLIKTTSPLDKLTFIGVKSGSPTVKVWQDNGWETTGLNSLTGSGSKGVNWHDEEPLLQFSHPIEFAGNYLYEVTFDQVDLTGLRLQLGEADSKVQFYTAPQTDEPSFSTVDVTNSEGTTQTWTGSAVSEWPMGYCSDGEGFGAANLKANGYVNSRCAVRGRRYTHEQALKACPTGYSLPSKAQYQDLFNAVGGRANAASALKSSSTWNGTNDWGFGLLASGWADQNNWTQGTENDTNALSPLTETYLWSADTDGVKASLFYATGSLDEMRTFDRPTSRLYAVRCIKD